MRGHAVLATIFRGDGDDDRLALRSRQAAVTLHQYVVILHERAEVFGPARVRAEDVWHEADAFAILRVDARDVVGKIGFGRLAEPGYASFVHRRSLYEARSANPGVRAS